MHSSPDVPGSDQVQHHLTELDNAVVGLLDATLTPLPDAEVTDTLRRLEHSLRTAAAIGHRLIVESVERGLPGHNGCSSVNNYLTQTLRISVGDAAHRVTTARKVGTWHTLAGHTLPPDLPATATAQRDGDIGSDHVEAVRHVIRKIPRTVPTSDVEAAEEVLAELARSATPEDVRNAGLALLTRLNPDGNRTDDKDRARLRGLTVGRQDSDLMTPIAGLLDPETRALLEPLLAKWARPGMNNPDDPASPTGDPEAPHADRAAMAQAASRDTRTAAQRGHDALKEALRTLQDSRVLGTHRGLPAATILTLGIDQLERETGVATTASGGVVPIRDALNLATRSHPVLLLFDRNGQPLHLYRTERLANADQRLALIGTDIGCTRPGCDAPATMSAVHHVTDWVKLGQTNIDELGFACDACHALIHDGPGGWRTRIAPADAEHPSRVEWTAPPHIDPEQRPRVNHRHHPAELLAKAHACRSTRRQRRHDPAHSGGGRASGGGGVSGGNETDGDVP